MHRGTFAGSPHRFELGRRGRSGIDRHRSGTTSRKALQRAGLTIDQVDVIELIEAFASQSIACMRGLGVNESKVNIDGGAIALGHPLGGTDERITAKAAQILQRAGGRYALAAQCIGGGQGHGPRALLTIHPPQE